MAWELCIVVFLSFFKPETFMYIIYSYVFKERATHILAMTSSMTVLVKRLLVAGKRYDKTYVHLENQHG